MKAAIVHEYGPEDVLKYEDVPDPQPGPNDVLIRVRAAALNRGDLGRRAGGYNPNAAALPLIIGWDIAGDIVAVGPEVTTRRVGERIVARLAQGGYAELATAPAGVAVPLPDDLSYEEAASLPVAFLTAWVALLETAALKPGETALVQSCGSGVGMAGVQIARWVAGARVITTAGTDEKCARGRKLGANRAVNYTTGDFLAEAMKFTNGRGVDVALDMVGGDVFARSQRALAPGGRLVTVGRASGEAPVADEALAKEKGHEVTMGWSLATRKTPEEAAAELAKIVDLIAKGILKTVIDKVFPLSEAAAAHRYLAGRNQFGKVVLRP